MIEINKDKCDLCGACVGVCPENVMHLTIHELLIDHSGCTKCSKCVWVCPVRALKLNLQTNTVLKSNAASIAS